MFKIYEAEKEAAKSEKREADFEAKERSRKYPCTGGAEVITARPAGMDYDTYREVRTFPPYRRPRLITKSAVDNALHNL